MFDIQSYPSFVIAIVVFQLIPGPGILNILQVTGRSGIRNGFAAVAGTLTGDFIYMVAAVLGLTALLSASPAIFRTLQWLGVGYLCYLGLQLMVRRRTADSETGLNPPVRSVVLDYRQAVFVGLSNPKAMLFFTAFFPLFLRQDTPSSSLVYMMLHVSLISFFYQAIVVVAGHSISRRLRRWFFLKTWAHRLSGIAFVVFGLKLAVRIQ